MSGATVAGSVTAAASGGVSTSGGSSGAVAAVDGWSAAATAVSGALNVNTYHSSGITLRVKRMSDDALEFTVSRTHAMLYSRAELAVAAAAVALLAYQLGSCIYSETCSCTASILLAFVVGARLLSRWNSVREESLLVMDSLGVQKRTTYWSGAQSHRFIDKANIAQIVINEGITMCSVVFYVAIMVVPSPVGGAEGPRGAGGPGGGRPGGGGAAPGKTNTNVPGKAQNTGNASLVLAFDVSSHLLSFVLSRESCLTSWLWGFE